jgi:hypothetical protein
MQHILSVIKIYDLSENKFIIQHQHQQKGTRDSNMLRIVLKNINKSLTQLAHIGVLCWTEL